MTEHELTKDWFRRTLSEAIGRCLSVKEQALGRPPPGNLRFNVRWSYPLDTEGRVKFLGGRLLAPGQLQDLSADRVAELLWVNGLVPMWINLSIESVEGDATVFEVAFANQLARSHRELRNQREGVAPFHLLDATSLSGWKAVIPSAE